MILLLAACLDYLIGDPWGWPHPVRVMGWIISVFTNFLFKQWSQGAGDNLETNFRDASLNSHVLDAPSQHDSFTLRRIQRRSAGILLGVGLIIGSGLAGWLMVRGANWVHPFVGIVVESILLASCFAGRSLRAAAEDVLQPLITGELIEARSKLSQYVGRDTEKLDESEILRAVLETVTENATDGVMAPLFYAIVGAFLPGVGSVPLALAYKAASTLDSMVGYRVEPYQDLGWFSAKLEDYLTWLPCRLAVLTLGLVSGKLPAVWNLCLRDARKDPSPNSGWSECAYAAILAVQLGGRNWYQGVAKDKPLLGDPIDAIAPAKIHQALQLTRYCFLIWLGLAIAILNLKTYAIAP